jgi:3-hydroxyisobutyrate dehydrogenase
MLPTGKHAVELYLGQSRLFSRASSAATLVDCSTIDSQTARELGAAAAERGFGFLDAPVSGGTAAAAAGTLAFMCGGAPETFERAKPVLGAMGKKLFHAGPAGAGQVAKACNNMLLAIHMIGSTEALSMGVRAGLAPEKLSEILLASSGRNWSLEVYNPFPGVMATAPASKGFAPGFMTDLMVKDLKLALDAAESSGLDVRMGRLAKDLFEEHQRLGHGHLDFSSIINRLGPRAAD